MFSIFEKLAGYISTRRDRPAEETENYERFLIRECPALEKSHRTGMVTNVGTDSSVIDDSIQLDHKILPIGTKLRISDKVVMRLFRNHEHENWQVESVDTVFSEFWNIAATAGSDLVRDDKDVQCAPGNNPEHYHKGFESLYVGVVTKTGWKDVIVDDGAYTFSTSDIPCEYFPVVGDLLSLELNEDVDDFGAKPVVKAVKHLRSWTTEGKVTQLDDRYGSVNQNITFNFRAIVGSYRPKLHDNVQVKCVEFNHAKYQWRAVALSPAPFKPNRQLPDGVRSRSQFLEELVKNKEGVVVQDVGQIPTFNLGDAHEMILIVKNTGSTAYKMGVKSLSDSMSSQLQVLEPVEEAECVAKGAVRVKLKITAKSLGQSAELCVFSFGTFKIGRQIVINVAHQEEVERKHASADSIKSMLAARRQKKNPDEIMARVEQVSFKISGERPFKPPMFAPNRLLHYVVPKQLWSFVVYREKLIEQYPCLVDQLTPNNYVEKLTLLLHLEEIEMTLRIREFDMKRVTFRRAGEFLALEVPGLAEKRPSLMIGDSAIAVNPWNDQGPENEGFIHQVSRTDVFLKFHQNLHESFGGEDCDVSFMFSRTPLRRCHQAVDIAGSHLGFDFLFPRKVVPKKPLINVLDEENNTVVRSPYYIVVKKRPPAANPKLNGTPSKPSSKKTVAQRLFEKKAAAAISAMNISASKHSEDPQPSDHSADEASAAVEDIHDLENDVCQNDATQEPAKARGIDYLAPICVAQRAQNVTDLSSCQDNELPATSTKDGVVQRLVNGHGLDYPAPIFPKFGVSPRSSPLIKTLSEKTEEENLGRTPETDHASPLKAKSEDHLTGSNYASNVVTPLSGVDFDCITVGVKTTATSPSSYSGHHNAVNLPPNSTFSMGQFLNRPQTCQALNSEIFSFFDPRSPPPSSKEIKFISPIVPARSPAMNPPKKPKLKWFNQELNKEQRSAVVRICRGEGRPLPYIVYGPPGTGKTVTIVEAVLQIYALSSSSRILVATPSNSSADLVSVRLATYGKLKPGTMVRLNSHNRSLDNIPEPILLFSSTCDDVQAIIRHRIIVTTCTTSGQIYAAGVKKGHFTHVFVDEAGQATEPDCLVPLGLVMADVGQVILAGDPKQLGPVVQSRLASAYGLEYSLLERLSRNDLYLRNETKFGDRGYYDPFLLTKLIRNYRSHEKLVTLPSRLFYDNDLVAVASETVNKLCQADFLPKKGVPLVFHGIRGQNVQENDDPSWFNPAEAYQVVTYLRDVLNAGIPASEVGIIIPYRKQVEKIRFIIGKLALESVKVGSVEEFQGQERDVIILSTVRSEVNLLEKDLAHSLGFVRSPKRFNVAITRAKSLLVVVGDPHLLQLDENWAALLKYCLELGAYTGCDLPVGYSNLDLACLS